MEIVIPESLTAITNIINYCVECDSFRFQLKRVESVLTSDWSLFYNNEYRVIKKFKYYSY